MKPKRLLVGEKIGVVALSAPVDENRFNLGLKYLGELGYPVEVALNPTTEYGQHNFLFSSDSVSARVQAFEELVRDPSIRAILAVRGAYGCMELLPHIDFNLIRLNPKPIIGFSDTTALLLACFQAGGVGCFHGCSLISGFAKASYDENAKSSVKALLGLISENNCNYLSNYTPRLLSTFERDQAEGILTGGNLCTIASMMGTPWEINLDDKIFFFEEVKEKPYTIHRMLLNLKLAGKFKKLKGVLVGSLLDCVHPKNLGPDIEAVIHDIFGELKIPVFQLVEFGHNSLNIPIPIGIAARISANKLELLEDAVLQ